MSLNILRSASLPHLRNWLKVVEFVNVECQDCPSSENQSQSCGEAVN